MSDEEHRITVESSDSYSDWSDFDLPPHVISTSDSTNPFGSNSTDSANWTDSADLFDGKPTKIETRFANSKMEFPFKLG